MLVIEYLVCPLWRLLIFGTGLLSKRNIIVFSLKEEIASVALRSHILLVRSPVAESQSKK
jgi:hypothetical protein